MLWSLSLAQYAAMPVLPAIAPDIAGMVGGSLADCVPSSFTLLAGLTASISFLWAAWLQVRLRNFQRRAKMDLVAADLAKSFKKALLTGAAEGAVVLKSRGREQQMSALPSAGGSTGSGLYSRSPAMSVVSQLWHTPVRHDQRVGTSQASASSSRLP